MNNPAAPAASVPDAAAMTAIVPEKIMENIMEKPPEKSAEKPLPVFSVRPAFDQPLAIVHALIAMVAGSALLTILGGIFLYILVLMLGLGRFVPPGYVFGLVLVASLIGVAPVFFDWRRKAYQRTIWHFYDTHVDFQFFRYYLGRQRGRLHYRDIANVAQRASALQEQRGLTTIYLYAPSMNYQSRGGFSGLKIFDVPLRADYMTRIMDIVEKSRSIVTPAA